MERGNVYLLQELLLVNQGLLMSSTSSLSAERKIVPKLSDTQHWVKSPATAKILVLHLDPPECLLWKQTNKKKWLFRLFFFFLIVTEHIPFL